MLFVRRAKEKSEFDLSHVQHSIAISLLAAERDICNILNRSGYKAVRHIMIYTRHRSAGRRALRLARALRQLFNTPHKFPHIAVKGFTGFRHQRFQIQEGVNHIVEVQ